MNPIIFSVDWEPWFSGTPYGQFWEDSDLLIEEPTLYLLDLLKRHKITAVFYILGWLRDRRSDLHQRIVEDGHVIGDHSYYHTYENWSQELLRDPMFRPPRWHGAWIPGWSGGAFLRALPYPILKRNLLNSGMFWVHPSDVMLKHPIKTIKHQIGLSTIRDKMERLCREVEFADPEKHGYK